MSSNTEVTQQQPQTPPPPQHHQSNRVRALHPDARAVHDERIRRVKNKPLFSIGGKMPDRMDEVPYTGESPAPNTGSAASTSNLESAAEHLFSKGHEMGYQLANTGEYKRTAQGDDAKPPQTSPQPQQPPPPPRRTSTAKKPPIGSTGGQVGGVINDATDVEDAQNRDHGKTNNDSYPAQQPYQRPGIPQRSFYKTMADQELGGEHQSDKTGQIGGVISHSADSNNPPSDNKNYDTNANSNDQNTTGQVGGEMHNQWLDTPETQEKYVNPNEPIHSWWYVVRENFREPLAEFLASMVFIIIGVGATVQTLVYTQNPTAAYSNLNWSWGVAVMTGVYISGGVSGGHLNPALTMALAIFRGFPWKMVWQYWIAQIFGMFCGSLIVYLIYYQALSVFDPAKTVSATGTSALFATFPATSLSDVGLCVFQQIISTAILTVTVLSLGDRDNSPPGASLGAFILALVIMALGSSLGALSGYPMNPARDISPRFALSCVGYGKELWTHDKWWWLTGPICGSMLGALLGGTAYDTFVYSGLGSPLNFTTKQWKRLIVHNMAKPGLDKQKRDDEARDNSLMNENIKAKGDKAV